MNWKIIIRNGFIGGILIIILPILLPFAGFYLARIFSNFILSMSVIGFFLLMIPVLITLFLTDLISELPGYSNNSMRKWEIILAKVISMILFVLFIFLALKSNFIHQKIESL